MAKLVKKEKKVKKTVSLDRGLVDKINKIKKRTKLSFSSIANKLIGIALKRIK